jgi:hypothetical protein
VVAVEAVVAHNALVIDVGYLNQDAIAHHLVVASSVKHFSTFALLAKVPKTIFLNTFLKSIKCPKLYF